MRKFLIVITLTVLTAAGMLRAEGVPVSIEGVSNLGMGGPGTTFWGERAILYNPALIGTRTGLKIHLFDLPVTISNDIFKFYKYFSDNQDELENFDQLTVTEQADIMKDITDKVSKYRVRFKLGAVNPNIAVGPFPFGRSGKLWWGAGFFNQADIGAKMNPGILVPTVDMWAKIDGVLAVPVAYKPAAVPFGLPGNLTAGVNLKYIIRYRYEEKRKSILEFEDFDVASDELASGSGFGWDWGLLYGYSDNLNFSLVLKDFLSTRIGFDDTSEVIKGRVSLGSSYKLTSLITLAGEFRDFEFNDIGKATLFTKLYMGGEVNLINILALRGGFYQGYPSFGFGLLGFLDYAFYGRELGRYPGDNPEWNHMISLGFGF